MELEKVTAALRVELEQAERRLKEAQLHHAKIKKAYLALTSSPTEDAVKKPRENLEKLVRDALEGFTQFENFTTRELFEKMQRPDLLYENTRSRIVMWLKRLVEDGTLEQSKRGVFRIPLRRTKKGGEVTR
jgi:hypothetical protein